LAWLLTRPTVTSLLVGAANLQQLEVNLRAADVALEADDLAKLDAATRPTTPYPHWFTPFAADAKAHERLQLKLSAQPLR
jgi:diketogulonate reductase-like aldo/keto reductase